MMICDCERHVILTLLAILLSVTGMAFSIAALVTPNWQIAMVHELSFFIESGLWINCQTPVDGQSRCIYSIFNSDLYYYTTEQASFMHESMFFAWHGHVSRLLVIAQLCTIVAIPCAVINIVCNFRPRKTAFIFAALLLLATFLHLVAIFVFTILTQMVAYRYYIGLKASYEKSRGYSFYLEVIGTMFILAAAVKAIISARFLVTAEQRERQRRQWTQQRNAVQRNGTAYVAMRQISSNATDNVRYWAPQVTLPNYPN